MEPAYEVLEKPTKKTVLVLDDTQFTLALLDKYQLSVFHETLEDADADADADADTDADAETKALFPQINPFLRQSLRNCRDNVSIKRESTNETDNYFVVTYKTSRKIPTSERITNFFTETPTPNQGTFGSRYSASVILFPLEDSPNLALVYLLGHWESLINRECIVINFGLITAASEGMAQVGKEGDMNCIKSAGTITTRGGISTKNWSKNRASLGKLSDLKCIREDSVLYEIRAKPNPSFGTKLISGKDGITLYLQEKLPTDTIEKAKYARCLRDNAFQRYKIYLKGPLAKEIRLYFDSPVSLDISQELFRKLDENWATFIKNKIIAYHEVLWSMVLNEPHTDKTCVEETLGLVNAGKSGTIIQIGRDRTRIANLISVQCVYLDKPGTDEKSYYRMERGTWFQMDECKLERIKANILENHLIDRAALNLPVAFEGKGEENEREEAYNKRAVDEVNAQETGKFAATLLDKELVYLKNPNKFELADVLLKKKSNARSPCYLIHVKKATKANNLGHLCDQVRRSAQFLSHNLNRSPAAATYVTKFIRTQIYSKHIHLPENKKMFDYFQKQKTVPKTHDDLMEMLNAYVTAKRSKRVAAVSEMIRVIDSSWDEWQESFKEMFNSLNQWLDCVVDFLTMSKNPAIPNAGVMKELLELMLQWLSKQKVFTKHTHGPMLPKHKRSITFVLAIIVNRAPEDYLIENKVILLDSVIDSVRGDGFECKVTFIPEISEIGFEETPETAVKRCASVAGFHKTQQKNKKVKVSLVKENSANVVNFTKDEDGAEKSAGKPVKKRAAPSSKQAGKPGGSPKSKMLLKKQKQDEEEPK